MGTEEEEKGILIQIQIYVQAGVCVGPKCWNFLGLGTEIPVLLLHCTALCTLHSATKHFRLRCITKLNSVVFVFFLVGQDNCVVELYIPRSVWMSLGSKTLPLYS